jgi:hypothetical protein
VTRKGPWSAEQIRRYLDEVRIPVRLACNGSSGHPVLVSLWFRADGERLWCATQRNAAAARHLRRDRRCAFEVAAERAPYRGVRGQAMATLHPDLGERELRTLIDRYLQDRSQDLARWLLARADGEVAIEIEPESLVSWDYSHRMQPDPC